jgi:hypothetical protein
MLIQHIVKTVILKFMFSKRIGCARLEVSVAVKIEVVIFCVVVPCTVVFDVNFLEDYAASVLRTGYAADLSFNILTLLTCNVEFLCSTGKMRQQADPRQSLFPRHWQTYTWKASQMV